jgi:hypothetical protein
MSTLPLRIMVAKYCPGQSMGGRRAATKHAIELLEWL